MVGLPSVCVLIYRGKAREITSRGYNEKRDKEGAVVILIWVRWFTTCENNVKHKLYMKQTPKNSISISNSPNRVHNMLWIYVHMSRCLTPLLNDSLLEVEIVLEFFKLSS
jgi:hypothetical protein